ncbi:MAG: HAD family hydrolase [Oscillospiraceae bacterium]|nr:HAD family hydrolase [Oscillospiraceae bacterium]
MYHKLTIEETLETLDVNPETGLSDAEAKERVAKVKTSEKSGSFSKYLYEAFARPTIYVLIVASILAVVFGRAGIAASLIGITAIHILLSALYRHMGEKTLDLSVSHSVTHAIVLRNGVKMKIKSDELVVGDVVTLKPGRVIPADLRLISSEELVIDESALTGFARCEKDCNDVIDSDVKAEARTNCAFEGTVVLHGRGDGVVIATGMSTEMSMLTLPLDVPEREASPILRKLRRSSRGLTAFSVIVAIATFFIGFIRKDPLLINVLTCTALIAATVPYGTFSEVLGVLSRGAKKLKNLGFFPKNESDIETLGAVSVFVADMPKIGVVATYTNGRIRTPQDEDTVPFLDGLLLCEFKDPSLRKFASHKCNAEEIMKTFPRTGELSGEVNTTLHRAGKATISYSGGEVWDILNRSVKIWEFGKVRTLTESDREDIDEAIRSLLDEGYSLTAVGMRFGDDSPYDTDLIFLGIAATCAEENITTTINAKELQNSGVKLYLLTEEDAEKARLGAAALSLSSDNLIVGREVERLSDDELAKCLASTSVFAGLRIRDKVRIINILKSRGKTVAAIGDRISDAPVLEAADVGISNIHAKDVAKDASGVLLDGTSSPDEAILCGKVTRANIKKTVTYHLATSITLLLTCFVGVVMGFGFPLSAAQLLLLSLITDLLPGVVISQSGKIPTKTLHYGIYAFCGVLGVVSAIIFNTFKGMGNTAEISQWYTFAIVAGLELLLLVPLYFLGRDLNGKRN